MPTQLEISLHNPLADQGWLDEVLDTARAAVNIARMPGYRTFTSGIVHIDHSETSHATLTTDSRWAASAIRSSLLDAGHAIDADPANAATCVTVWKIHQNGLPDIPDLRIDDQAADPKRPGFLLRGPDGYVEQQCGASGHNQLVTHAGHPYPGSARIICDSHGEFCWQRYSWPQTERARHLVASTYTEAGTAVYGMTEAAEQRMRSLYLSYIHTARH